MGEIVKATAANAGCWVEGSRGRYGVTRLIEIAEQHGWTGVGLGDNLKAVACYEYADRECASYPDCDCTDVTVDLADKAEAWLNEHVAPTGYQFGWHEGEFFLWPDDAWSMV